MCEPTTLAVLSVASAGMAAYGQYQQGQSAEKMANYNAEVSRVKAADALSTGAIAEERTRAQVRQIKGAQIAAMGASGGEVGAGSFGEILDQTTRFGELDALTVRANALKTAYGFNTQAEADSLQGAMLASQGRFNAAGSLLKSAPDIYSKGKAADWWK